MDASRQFKISCLMYHNIRPLFPIILITSLCRVLRNPQRSKLSAPSAPMSKVMGHGRVELSGCVFDRKKQFCGGEGGLDGTVLQAQSHPVSSDEPASDQAHRNCIWGLITLQWIHCGELLVLFFYFIHWLRCYLLKDCSLSHLLKMGLSNWQLNSLLCFIIFVAD